MRFLGILLTILLAVGCTKAEREALAGLSSSDQPNNMVTPETMLEAYDEGNYVLALEQALLLGENGNPRAQAVAANIFYQGQNVDQDFERSFFWCKKSAEQGFPEGVSLLGLHYFYGKGVHQDKENAAALLEQGRLRGSKVGREELQQLRASSNKIKVRKAIGEWFDRGKCQTGKPCGRKLLVDVNIANTLDEPLISLSCVTVATVEFGNGEKRGYTSKNLCDDSFANALMTGLFFGELAAYAAHEDDNRWSIQPGETRNIGNRSVAEIPKEYIYYGIESVRLTMDVNGTTPFGKDHSERLLDINVPPPKNRQQFSLLLK